MWSVRGHIQSIGGVQATTLHVRPSVLPGLHLAARAIHSNSFFRGWGLGGDTSRYRWHQRPPLATQHNAAGTSTQDGTPGQQQQQQHPTSPGQLEVGLILAGGWVGAQVGLCLAWGGQVLIIAR